MADVSEKLLNGEGLAELWRIICNKYDGLYEHWWRLQAKINNLYYEEYEAFSLGSCTTTGTPDPDSVIATVYYSDELTFSGTEYELSDPQEIDVTYNNAATVASVLAGKYIRVQVSTKTYYRKVSDPAEIITDAKTTIVPVESPTGATSNMTITTYSAKLVSACAFVYVPATAFEDVSSPDRNAYPDSGEDDEWVYQYIGTPFDRAMSGARCQTGIYMGAGTYGESGANSVTFDFEPWLFWIVTEEDEPETSILFPTTEGHPNIVCLGAMPSKADFTEEYGVNATNSVSTSAFGRWNRDAKTYEWYYDAGQPTVAQNYPTYQLNKVGVTYKWFAIG